MADTATLPDWDAHRLPRPGQLQPFHTALGPPRGAALLFAPLILPLETQLRLPPTGAEPGDGRELEGSGWPPSCPCRPARAQKAREAGAPAAAGLCLRPSAASGIAVSPSCPQSAAPRGVAGTHPDHDRYLPALCAQTCAGTVQGSLSEFPAGSLPRRIYCS